jgi:hypothetical protein
VRVYSGCIDVSRDPWWEVTGHLPDGCQSRAADGTSVEGAAGEVLYAHGEMYEPRSGT